MNKTRPRTCRSAVFITGASGGIGFAAARALRERGFEVFAAVRNSEDAQKLRGLGPSVNPVILEVTDSDSIRSAVETVAEQLDGQSLVGLVNSAGILVEGPIELLPMESIRRQYEINVFAVVAVTKAFLPLLRQSRGTVVNIGAVSAEVAIPMLGAISSSKAAMRSISDVLRVELQPWSITTCLIEPGAIQTEIFTKAKHEADATFGQIPQGPVEKQYLETFARFREAMAKGESDQPRVVVDAIMHALTSKKPKTKYIVGKGAGGLAFLRFLPDKSRDRLLTGSLKLARE